MLICEPNGICSWNFRILENNKVEAYVRIITSDERIDLQIQDEIYQVRYEESVSFRFRASANLLHEGKSLAKASCHRFLPSKFEIESPDLSFELVPKGVLSRKFEFLLNGNPVGYIMSDHPFTKRSRIECQPVIPTRLQLFCFTLVANLWRNNALNMVLAATP